MALLAPHTMTPIPLRAAAHLAAAVTLCAQAAVLLSAPPASAAATVNAGTLTCTLTPPPQETERVDFLASCTFQGLTGRKAFFDGTVARLGEEDEPSARIVLVWSVQAPDVDVPLEALEGKYAGLVAPEDADAAPTSLRGGRDDTIELVPLTPEPGAIPGAQLSVLELTLTTMRT